MKSLDLETDRALIELLEARLRALEFGIVDIAQHATATGSPELADRLNSIIRDIFEIQGIPEVLASRERRPPAHSNKKEI